ncbi:MAG: cell division protein FtsQ [Bdellovibrionaceae bacterium]|nr:cell division protein FtsQ [Pseudobdellovibrionaceae bacterium]
MKILKYNFLGLVLLFIFALLFVEAKNQSMHRPQYHLLENASWTLGESQKQEYEKLVEELNSQASALWFLNGYRQQLKQLKSLPFIQNVNIRWSLQEPVRIESTVSEVKAMLFENGKWSLLNSEGEVLKTITQNQTLDLPIISSKKVLEETKLKQKAFKIFAALENSENFLTLKQVSEVSVDKRGLYFIFSPGYKVYLADDNFSSQFQRVSEVFKYLEMRKIEVEFVDSQFKNKILVRPTKKSTSAL